MTADMSRLRSLLLAAGLLDLAAGLSLAVYGIVAGHDAPNPGPIVGFVVAGAPWLIVALFL